jgi:hypothetical protein
VINILLFIVLIVLLIGGLPHWPYMARLDAGYFPSGAVGLLLIVLVILLLTGRL